MKEEFGDMSKLRVWLMPKDWVINFIAAWRVFERTMNPAFHFLIKCANCGAIGQVEMVHSKNEEGMLIGMQCLTDDCGQTLKFGRKIGVNSPDFPERLAEVGESVLTDPQGEEAAGTNLDVELMTELVFDDHNG